MRQTNHWFKLDLVLPPTWANYDQVLRRSLGPSLAYESVEWDSSGEGLIFDEDGLGLQGTGIIPSVV